MSAGPVVLLPRFPGDTGWLIPYPFRRSSRDTLNSHTPSPDGHGLPGEWGSNPKSATLNLGTRIRSAARRAIPKAVDIVRLSVIPGYDINKLIAQPLIEGSQSNVRVIKLSPGQALPPHRHGSSDLMLFVVEGEGVLKTERGTVDFTAGSLAFFRGDEELRVSNEGRIGLTMLAFLAPPFPPRTEK